MHHLNHADHPRHDLTLIAGHAAGDLPDTDRVHADVLLSSCAPCADLHRDLIVIAAATRSLPAPALPARDFRLDREQAERLRRGSWLRAALRPFAASRSAVRPMAAAFTSLGLAGLLVAIFIPSLFGSAASPGAERDGGFEAVQASAGAAAPGSTQGPILPQGAQASNDRAVVEAASGPPGHDLAAGGKTQDGATAAPQVAVAGGATNAAEEPAALDSGAIAAPAANPLIAGSIGLLLVGLLMFGLRAASRRLR